MAPLLTVLNGDAITQLTKLPDRSVQCCVTSPPYWGLRDYGCAGQLGLEKTPEEYVANMLQVFREVRRVLKDDGTSWINLGDSYASTWSCGRRNAVGNGACDIGQRIIRTGGGLKEKDLVGIPWMVAFALRSDGWYLRSDIIWHKPNPMPESVADRPTKSHEYLFLLSKSQRYFYDAEAILEPVSGNTHARLAQNLAKQVGSFRANGGNKTNGPMKAVARKGKEANPDPQNRCSSPFREAAVLPVTERNKRSVWTVPTQSYGGAHFATFPPDLIKPCILAGSKPGDTILDPFGGSGTTGMVALELGRKSVLIELNAEYVKLIHKRCDITPGLALA